MREYKYVSMIDILSRSSALGKIVYKVDQLAKLNRTLLNKLDPELARHCRLANCREGIIILTTTSPATGHLLRFKELELLSALRADPDFCHLKSIKIQVRPADSAYTPSQTLPLPMLSVMGASTVRATAEEVESPSLRQALLRLSKRVQNNN